MATGSSMRWLRAGSVSRSLCAENLRELTQASGVVSAAAFVLERMGATEQGVGLMLKDVGEKLRALEAAMAHSEAGPSAPLTPQSAAETHVPGGPKRASEGG
eukprot:1072281-Rhodomonas_salina.1